MAKQSGDDYPTLSAQFDEYLKLFNEIESSELPTVSEELQKKVEKCIESLEKATYMVSQIGLFSDNEVVEELPTSSLKFLLLPALLGGLMLKRMKIPRTDVLNLSKIYFLDYLKRCKEYDITNVSLEQFEENEDSETPSPFSQSSVKSGPPTAQELRAMGNQREQKIARYREKAKVEKHLMELQKRVDLKNDDSETIREYYMTLINKTVHQSLDELDSITMEESMLKEVMKRGGGAAMAKEPPKKSTFKPFIITKDKIQKEVFGLGYPSLPAMSVEEFYDKRVKEGWFPDPTNPSKCCGGASKPSPCENHAPKEPEDDEITKEKKLEEDDSAEIERLRERDEWRDTHRTGWGNTYNRS